MPIDSRDRFTETAELYRLYRPSYPPALFERLEAITSLRAPARVIDLGCGTGISTRLLASRGFSVTGVDPNLTMLEAARAEGGAQYVQGECTKTGLADGSADLVTAAQAFHWFPVEATLAEIRRALKPSGWASAFWNVRAETPMSAEYEALLRSQSSDYGTLRTPEATLDEIAASPSVQAVQRFQVTNEQRFDREGLRGRAWSSSYVVHGVSDRAKFDAALDVIFDRHHTKGQVTFAYDVKAIVFRTK